MNRNLLILGAGQYGNVVKEMAAETGKFNKIAFLDDRFCINKDFPDLIVGKFCDIGKFISDFTYAIPAIGNIEVRHKLFYKALNYGYEIPTLISPAAYVAESARLGRGVIVEALAGVHTQAVVGDYSYISMGAVVNHNAVVSEGCHIENNAVIMSEAFVPSETTVEPCQVIGKK